MLPDRDQYQPDRTGPGLLVLSLGALVAIVAVIALVRPTYLRHLTERAKEMAVRLGWVPSPETVEQAERPNVEKPACEPEEVLRTMSTRWAATRDTIAGRALEFVNLTGRVLFLRLLSAAGDRLIETIVLMPGERMKEPVFADEMKLEVLVGTTWCNRLDGWMDSRRIPVGNTVRSSEGVLQLVFEPTSGPQTMALVIRKQPPGVGPASNPQTRPRPASPLVQAQPPRKLAIQPPQSRQVAPWGLNSSVPAGGASPGLPREAAPAGNGNDLPLPEPAERWSGHLQDWRDVPPRDIRLVSSGERHFLTGQVGDRDVQFEVSMTGFSAIGEALAKNVGAHGCYSGPWLVMGRYWGTCRVVVPRVSFGTVELENVAMVVLPGQRQPVLAPDVLGRFKLFDGKDGKYISVGG